MNKYLTKGRIALLVIFSVLIIDQIIKIYIKTHMYWHQSENVIKWLYEKLGMVDAEPPTWFYIYFTENNGMAFGMEIFGKLIPHLVPYCCGSSDRVVSDKDHKARLEDRVYRMCVSHSYGSVGEYHR